MSSQTESGHATPTAPVGTVEPHGLLAEFLEPDEVLRAAERARAEGYRSMEAYTPFPIDGLAEAIGFQRNRVALIVLIGGLCGGFLAFFMQWFSAVIHYPINVGGRPYNTWPAFMVICFELSVLGGALSAVIGMLALNGLPKPYHPVFNASNFALASRDRFFLCIQADDPRFDLEQTRRFLESLNPKEISEVEC